MDKEETTQEESIDQPVQESETDQPEEESQDQPSKEVEEDNTDQSEENQESETIEIDGKQYDLNELKEYISKGKDYTKKTQELAEMRKQIVEMQPQQPTQQQKLSPEEEEIQEARETLQKYGAVTEDQLDAKFKDFQAKQAKANEFAKFKQDHPELTDMAGRMIEGAANAWGKSFEDIYQEGWSQTPQKKVVKKKTVGASKRASTPVSGKGGGVVPTRQQLKEMPDEKYQKLVNSGQIDQWIAEGRL